MTETPPGYALHLAPTPGEPRVVIPGMRAEVGVGPDGSVAAGTSLPPGTRHWLSLAVTPQGCAVQSHVQTFCDGQPLPATAQLRVGSTLSAGPARLTLEGFPSLAASTSEAHFTPPASRPSGFGLLSDLPPFRWTPAISAVRVLTGGPSGSAEETAQAQEVHEGVQGGRRWAGEIGQ